MLLHDMEEEDLPFVATSELSYLRRVWPKTLFMFMSRYQHDLERMRKECKERFGCTQSGNCTHCGRYIQRDLDKHIALYHLELAQLWRCPVLWCTVRKGTAQDCIDHMRRTHDVPLTVKAANLARYFPPMDLEDGPLLEMGLPGCPYRFSEYGGQPFSDGNPAFGLELHHPRFLEFVGAPESARPTFWVDQLGQEQAMAAAVNLQRDAGIMLSNLQILSQFATSLHRMSSEMMVSARRCFHKQRSLTCRRRRGRLGRLNTCWLWVCGALRRVRVIPGQCRLRHVARV